MPDLIEVIEYVVIGVLLIVLYVVAPRLVHFTVRRTLETQADDLEEGGVEATELDKRSTTLEGLATTLIRVTLVAVVVAIIIIAFDMSSMLTLLAFLLAALTLAGHSIVLDYLMGILIVVEGSYFQGDNIKVGDMFGDVEEVGLRRTTVRSPDGTVHSISNGELRVVSNRTRIFAAAEVKVGGIRDEDLDRVIELMVKVGQDVADDPEFAEDILEAHELKFVEDPDDLGITAIVRGKVVAAKRWRVATEIRRRLNGVLLEEGIELNKRGVTPRLPRRGKQPVYVPEPEDNQD